MPPVGPNLDKTPMSHSVMISLFAFLTVAKFAKLVVDFVDYVFSPQSLNLGFCEIPYVPSDTNL
jgi:hypothetical protein